MAKNLFRNLEEYNREKMVEKKERKVWTESQNVPESLEALKHSQWRKPWEILKECLKESCRNPTSRMF